MNKDDSIAKKYAVAFLNLYLDELTISDIERLGIFEHFLKKNRHFYISLGIPSIKLETKRLALDKISENFQFKKPISKLMNALLISGRIEILHKVLRQIRFGYTRRTNIQFFKVVTSHELNIQDKKTIVKLIQQLSNAKIRTRFLVNKRLIVGIRIESPSLLWERSIKKELLKVSQSIAKEGIRC